MIQALASGLGILFLTAIATTLARLVSSDGDFMSHAMIFNLFSIGFAIAAWTGVLFRSKRRELPQPVSWGMWLGMFPIGLAFSVLFLLMDCDWHFPFTEKGFHCEGHPGFGAIFTIGAILMTVIALPSALRDWILDRFKDRNA
jgi:hypothetical protein